MIVISSPIFKYIPKNYAGEESITFPNGMIRKRGQRTASGQVTFAVEFPNACEDAFCNLMYGGAGIANISAHDTTGLTIWNDIGGGTIEWEAWGY